MFYGDYHLFTSEKKWKSVLSYLTDLKSRGVPIDGIGYHSHINETDPLQTREHMAEVIKSFGDIGLLVLIDEIDVRCYDCGGETLSSEALENQGAWYNHVIKACLDNPGVCIGITSWGMSDSVAGTSKRHCLDEEAGGLGAECYPLPFDWNW